MGSGLVEWLGTPVAGCIPVCWAGPSLLDGAYTGSLAALQLLLRTTHFPSLGIKTHSSLCIESPFEVVLPISAWIHDVS